MNHERHEKHEPVLFKDECYQIQGAIFEVYREMGCGFLESVYQECLESERTSGRIARQFWCVPKGNGDEVRVINCEWQDILTRESGSCF